MKDRTLGRADRNTVVAYNIFQKPQAEAKALFRETAKATAMQEDERWAVQPSQSLKKSQGCF